MASSKSVLYPRAAESEALILARYTDRGKRMESADARRVGRTSSKRRRRRRRNVKLKRKQESKYASQVLVSERDQFYKQTFLLKSIYNQHCSCRTLEFFLCVLKWITSANCIICIQNLYDYTSTRRFDNNVTKMSQLAVIVIVSYNHNFVFRTNLVQIVLVLVIP